MVELITYTSDLDTDFKKLCAVYSLLEQMRLVHNKAGALARTNRAKYENKWVQFAKIFKAKQLLLLQEQNKLRLAIRRANYTDAEWKSLTDEDRWAAFGTLFGDKQALKLEPTLATSELLTQLKAIDLTKLNGQFVDPTEDFTTYTEVDAGDDITVTASQVNVDTMLGNPNSYVYKDYTAGHFGDFEHLITLNYIGEVGTTSAFFYVVANVYGTGSVYRWQPSIVGSVWNTSLYLRAFPSANTDTYVMGFNLRYLTTSRNGTTATMKVYSDSARTTLLDTLSVTCVADTWRYLIVAAGGTDNGAEESVTYSVADLDLQEAAVAGILRQMMAHHGG